MPGPSVRVQSRLPDTGQRNDIEPHSAQMLRFAARTRLRDCGLEQLSSSNNVAQPCMYSQFRQYLLDHQRSYTRTQCLVGARGSGGADCFWVTPLCLRCPHEPTSDVRGTLRLACRSRTSDTA